MQEGESGVECGLRKGKTNHTIGCGCGCGCECGCGCGCVCGRDYVHPALGLAKIVPVNNWSERQPFHTCPLGFHFFLSISLILNKRFKPLTSRYRVSFLINPLSRALALSPPTRTGEYRRIPARRYDLGQPFVPGGKEIGLGSRNLERADQ